jgi:hypothetical protein
VADPLWHFVMDLETCKTKATHSLKRQELLDVTTQRHTLEDWNPQWHRCEDLKIHTSKANCDTLVLVSFLCEVDLVSFTLCGDAAK